MVTFQMIMTLTYLKADYKFFNYGWSTVTGVSLLLAEHGAKKNARQHLADDQAIPAGF